jgi:hypothetical protein
MEQWLFGPSLTLGTCVAVMTEDAPGTEWVEARDVSATCRNQETPTENDRPSVHSAKESHCPELP